jgi:hypothetical protein
MPMYTTGWKNLCGFASIATAVNHSILTSNSLSDAQSDYLQMLGSDLGIKGLNKDKLQALLDTYGPYQMQVLCAPTMRRKLAEISAQNVLDDCIFLDAVLIPGLESIKNADVSHISSVPALAYLDALDSNATMKIADNDEEAKTIKTKAASDLAKITAGQRTLADCSLVDILQTLPNSQKLYDSCIAIAKNPNATYADKKNLAANLYLEIGENTDNNAYMANIDNLSSLAKYFGFNIHIKEVEYNNEREIANQRDIQRIVHNNKLPWIELANVGLHWERSAFKGEEQPKKPAFTSTAVVQTTNQSKGFTEVFNAIKQEIKGIASIINLSEVNIFDMFNNKDSKFHDDFVTANNDLNEYLDLDNSDLSDDEIKDNFEEIFEAQRKDFLLRAKLSSKRVAEALDEPTDATKRPKNT